LTSDEVKAMISVPEVLARYGIEVKRGRCKGFCHNGKDLNAKVTNEFYYCYVCDKGMDIFEIVQYLDNCDFKAAFEILGGTEKPSFTTYIKAAQAKKRRDMEIKRLQIEKAKVKKIQLLITAHRNIIAEAAPLSDLWCYCQNKLQYQIYLLESHDEKR
jgi:hypothetical protein